jgi:hypothetical protein
VWIIPHPDFKRKEVSFMANARAGVYARNMRTFGYMQDKLIAVIDKRAKRKAADEDVLSKHLSGVNEDGERTWTFD